MRRGIYQAIAVLAFALMFIGAIMSVEWPEGSVDDTSSEDVGWTLFGDSESGGYGLVVLLIGLLLLVALLGGVFLAKEEEEE
ncbi:MAG: hypothetical protein JW880_07645 [Candidatus Thermoplasmatota archaeon]|nr:hypothetical protein [Candidatus Thermoplasmatota archaeon]